MRIEPFRIEDIELFLKLSADEKWLAEAWEFRFLLSVFAEGCFTARDEIGNAIGFVTSIRHDRSGWIGNLIVQEKYRGNGIGEELFLRAMHSLYTAGAETIWLTASKMGIALYEKHGFKNMDTIIRWTGQGQGESKELLPKHDAIFGRNSDRAGWGDQRKTLMDAVVNRGSVWSVGTASLVVQPCANAVQIGPFSATVMSDAGEVLAEALGGIPKNSKVYVDTPAANQVAFSLFTEAGFMHHGINKLMSVGSNPEYRPEYIYGLATLGSCG